MRADGSSPAEPVVKLRRKDLIRSSSPLLWIFCLMIRIIFLWHCVLSIGSYPDVYKINISDSKAKRKRTKKWRFGTQWWMTDRQHRLRLGSGEDDNKGFYRLLDLQTNKWRRIWEYESFEEPEVEPLGFAADPNQLYVRADHKGRYAIFKVDLSDPDLSKELVYSDPNYDIEESDLFAQNQ